MNFRKKANKFTLVEGTLHYVHPKSKSHLRVIKASEKVTILTACHVTPASGHLGVNKSSDKVMSRYYWPGSQYADICNFIVVM